MSERWWDWSNAENDILELQKKRQQFADMQAQSQEEAALRPLRIAQAQYGLRGQLLGPVETADQLNTILPQIRNLGLPTGDMPQEIKSEAWKTFAKQPEPARLPAYMPEAWRPKVGGERMDLPGYMTPVAPPTNEMPAGPLQNAQDLSLLKSAQERGLPLAEQSKQSAADIRAMLEAQRLETEKRKLDIWEEGMKAKIPAEEMKRKIQAENEAFDRAVKMQQLGLENKRFNLEEVRTLSPIGVDVPGYTPTPGITPNPTSAKAAQTASSTLAHLNDLVGEYEAALKDIEKSPGSQFVGPKAQTIDGIRQRMLLGLKEAENLGVLQKIDVETMAPIVPNATRLGAVKSWTGISSPRVALDQFRKEVNSRLGNVISQAGYTRAGGGSPKFRIIRESAPQAQPASQPTPTQTPKFRIIR